MGQGELDAVPNAKGPVFLMGLLTLGIWASGIPEVATGFPCWHLLIYILHKSHATSLCAAHQFPLGHLKQGLVYLLRLVCLYPFAVHKAVVLLMYSPDEACSMSEDTMSIFCRVILLLGVPCAPGPHPETPLCSLSPP